MKAAKQKRFAINANRLLVRRDARAVRRCKYWIRRFDPTTEFTPEQLRRPQAPFDLVCIACGVNPHQWDEPMTVDLGDGVLVKDTPSHLREIGVLE